MKAMADLLTVLRRVYVPATISAQDPTMKPPPHLEDIMFLVALSRLKGNTLLAKTSCLKILGVVPPVDMMNLGSSTEVTAIHRNRGLMVKVCSV